MKRHTIELSNEELLVFHELLIRVNEEKLLDKHFIDQSEQVMLWYLEWMCEKKNASAFSWNYLEKVKKARDNLKHDKT